jgi:hypothetical protein
MVPLGGLPPLAVETVAVSVAPWAVTVEVVGAGVIVNGTAAELLALKLTSPE